MKGAESLVRTLVDGGIDVCFMNPGTSEIHFVDALDRVRDMRGVPCLFEGVASGAADGYARMSGKPACTLFHLGPGLGNALANLHNAFRAKVPMVNIVGDHATFHRQFDPPLAADIESIARPYSKWFRSSASSAEVGRDCAEAIAAALAAPAGIATLVVPTDVNWDDGGRVGVIPEIATPPAIADRAIATAVSLLRNGKSTAVVLGPRLAEGDALVTAARIATATGARLLVPFNFPRVTRGAGLPPVERIAYVVDQALTQLREFEQFILVGASQPVAFFAYPGKPSLLTPEDSVIHTLAEPRHDGAKALSILAAALGAAKVQPHLEPANRPAAPSGAITIDGLAAAIGAALPERVIVADESITSGRGLFAATRGAPPHDWLVNTGGSIGVGMPFAVGAAVACPDRPVLCLESDGSGMYTLQALWTAARENLAVTTVIFANRSYAILKGELAAASNNPGPRALDMLDIGRPDLDWVALAKGMGVHARRVTTLEAFTHELRRGIESREPNLIEVPL